MSPVPSRIRAPKRVDLTAIVDLLNACDVAETGRPDTTAEDVAADWDLPGFELARDAWLAEARDHRLVGYAYTGDQFRTGELEAGVWTHPRDAEPDLTRRLLRLAERRARELASRRGYPDPTLDVFCISTDEAKRDLLLEIGFAMRRTVVRMAIDLEADEREPDTPAGIAVRPLRPGIDDRVVYETMTEALAGHDRRSDEPFAAWQTRLQGRDSFDPGLWAIAWAGDEPAGALIAYDYGDLGWVREVGVLPAWRGRGIGGALLAHAFAEFRRREQLRVELGVDAEGELRSLGLYERAGMRAAFSYDLFEKPLTS